MLKSIISIVMVATLTGCSIFPTKPNQYSCNEPYLKKENKPFGDDEYLAARNGYMYVTAAALALQGSEKKDKDHWIGRPERLVPIEPDPFFGTKGFQARAFLLYDKQHSDQIEALVIAYTGSQTNDFWNDWVLANFAGKEFQYDQARELFQNLVAKYPNVHKRVVTGFSLGGGLAAHVALHPDTSKYVSEAWTFNPSGRIHDMRPKEVKKAMAYSVERDARFWLVANDVEIVRYTRSNIGYKVFGLDWIPAPDHQFVNKVKLRDANAVTGHFRYVLFRDLLWAAELDARSNKIEPNEPLKILQETHFSGCKEK